ncbi:hypothetical protein D4Z93_05090 [Clostridium fermenticellae]|uniref:Uncharacterized protein n=1 Tax=Clostridium fermenticellae TaxID=2068654 RepID=A0A386H2P5_9CLOT|nr:hypothetical protein [Clostridium fermenticellae]AYD39924.1 hypothetical protein D4Z93_05090 [Clostridium fermenticellae]
MSEKYWPETVILWGAGATKSLGLYATRELIQIVVKINKNDFSFLEGKNEKLRYAFKKLVTEDLVKDPILCKIYDLEALQLIIGTNTKVNMHELFTMLDQLIGNKMGFNAFISGKTYFLRRERVEGAKRCLILLIEELERLSIQFEPGYMNKDELTPYYEFSRTLTDLMKEEAFEFDKRGYVRTSRRFYLYSYAIISFNWDPIIMWNIFNAHKEFNDKSVFLNCGLKLRLFDDFGTQIAGKKIDSINNEIWYTVGEPQCKRINDYEYPSRIIRIGKILFPHGIFDSRVCPECGKYITTFGGSWCRLSTEVFGPSIVDELQKNWKYRSEKELKSRHGAIECPYCGQITYPSDMPLIMQTMAKKQSIAPLEEVKTEVGLLMKNAKHIVFAGYSLPIDDIMVKTFFMSSIAGNDKRRLKCTVLNYDKDYSECGWITGDKISDYLKCSTNKEVSECIENVCDIFDIENVRVSLEGIPNIFMENGKCSREKIKDLLYPKEYFKGGFPITRD